MTTRRPGGGGDGRDLEPGLDAPERILPPRPAADSANPGQAIAVAILVGLVVMTCAGVSLTGAALLIGDGAAGEATATQPVEEPMTELPSRTGSRGEIPVERGLRRGGAASGPKPSRPDVPDPTD